MKRLSGAIAASVALLVGVWLFSSTVARAGAYNVNIISPLDDSTIYGSPVITGTGPSNESVAIFIDGVFVNSATTDSSGNWAYTTSGLSVGNHTVKALYPKNFYAFVSNKGDYNISVIETITDSKIGDFDIDSAAILQDVVVTPDHSKAYVLDNSLANNGVWMVDIETYSVGMFPIDDGGDNPYAASMNIDGSKVYIINYDTSDMSIINTVDNSVSGPHSLASLSSPTDIAVRPSDGDRAYIANLTGNNIVVVDLGSNTEMGTISLACAPNSIVFSPSGLTAYASETCNVPNSPLIEVIDVISSTVTDTIPDVGASNAFPQSLAITPDGLKLLVTDLDNDRIFIISTADYNDIVSVGVGNQPVAVSPNYNGTKAYVTNMVSNDVSVIDLTSNSISNASISVGNLPNGLGILEDFYFSEVVDFIVKTPEVLPVVHPKNLLVNYKYEPSVSDVSKIVSTINTDVQDTIKPNATIDNRGQNKKVQLKTTLSLWFKIGLGLFLLLIIAILLRLIYKAYKDNHTE